jgi:hypothetical protein
VAGCESVCCVLHPLPAPKFVVAAQKVGSPMVPRVWTTMLEGMVGPVERYAFPISHPNGKTSDVADECRYWIVYPGADLAAFLRYGGYADRRQGGGDGWQEPSLDKLGRGSERYAFLLLPLIAFLSHDPSLVIRVFP